MNRHTICFRTAMVIPLIAVATGCGKPESPPPAETTAPVGLRHQSGVFHAARASQKSSILLDKVLHRSAMIEFAPRTDHSMPDCLRRLPMTFLHPASMTPDPTKRPRLRKSA